MNTATSTPDEQPQCPRCGTPLVIDPEIMRRNCLNCGFREEPAMATLAYAQSIAANIADLAKLEKELAQLRADNKVLAEEVRAWRKVNGSAQYVRTLARLRADRQSIEEAMKISQSFMDDSLPIIKATDASGALSRANKEPTP